MTIENSEEYRAISEFYGTRRANRSRVPYMNHINEGIFILETQFPGSLVCQKAFCLHPLFQQDEELKRFYDTRSRFDQEAVVIAMEYRHVANAHLPRHPVKAPEEIYLGPLLEVARLLRADKIQNCKDFEQFNRNHPNYERLSHYFHKEWFPRLSISEIGYKAMIQQIADNKRERWLANG